MPFKIKLPSLITWSILIFVVRLFLSLLPPMAIDHGCWRAWSARMVEVGPTRFYSPDIFTANPPGWLYMFWWLGEIKTRIFPQMSFYSSSYDWMLKLPNNLADLATGWLIYLIIKKRLGEKTGCLGFLLYVLNPVTWFNSAIFGQFDGSGTFFGLFAVYLLLEKKKIFLAAATFAVAWAIKPQAIALAPALGLFVLMNFKLRDWVKGALAFFATTWLIYWPFFPNNPATGVIYVFKQMAAIYSCTTCFTFNFWGLWGNWRLDTVLFSGLPLLYWGMIFFGLSLILIFIFRSANNYFTIALSVLAFNQFITRMHERYVFPFFGFFLIATLLLRSRILFIVYILFSFFNTLNVYYPYAYYNPNFHLTPNFIIWLNQHFRLMSLIGVAIFMFLLIYLIILSKKKYEKKLD